MATQEEISMEAPLLEVHQVSKNFGGIQALNNVSFKVYSGERVGLIGPNGSGKTTMINIISGVYKADKGKILFNGKDVTKLPAHKRTRLGMSRTFQIPRPFTSLTVLENVMLPLISQSHSFGHNYDSALDILRLLSLNPDLKCNELTLIELRKLELARALAAKPKLLMLDETLAGLTEKEIYEMLGILRKINEQGVTMIMIEHVMKAVMSLSERIIVFSSGTMLAEGKPAEVRKNERVVEVYLGE